MTEISSKIFCFRWDIDHLYGLERGVPNILDVAKKYNIKCTFFINLGRSVSLSQWFLKSPAKTWRKATDQNSINLIKKVGYWGIARALFWRKDVGLERVDILKRIIAEGHELGLHGIYDHLLWSRELGTLSLEFLDKEISRALDFFQSTLGFRPVGFAAPGFKYNRLSLEMTEKYFSYGADVPGAEPFRLKCADGQMSSQLQIPVTIIGPETVPLIEYLSARGVSNDQIITKVKEEILSRDFALIYGHPCYEGLKTEILDEIFRFVREQNYQVMTMKEINDRYQQSNTLAIRAV